MPLEPDGEATVLIIKETSGSLYVTTWFESENFWLCTRLHDNVHKEFKVSLDSKLTAPIAICQEPSDNSLVGHNL